MVSGVNPDTGTGSNNPALQKQDQQANKPDPQPKESKPVPKPKPQPVKEMPAKTHSPERRVRAAAEAYYANVEYTDWDYTYNHLASETLNTYSRDEWANKNAALYDPSIDYKVDSVMMESPTKADVVVVLALGDGSTSFRNTYFVKENGRWLHSFSDAEYALFASAGATATASASLSSSLSASASASASASGVPPLPADGDYDCSDFDTPGGGAAGLRPGLQRPIRARWPDRR